MEASSLVTQTGWNQCETLLTGKRDEARLEPKANKSTLHTCICCVSLPHDVDAPACTQTETRGKALPGATYST